MNQITKNELYRRLTGPTALLTIVLLTASLMPACESPESGSKALGDPNTAEGLVFQYILGQVARPVFYLSYNYQTAAGYCRNTYKIPLLDFSTSDAACQNDVNCTIQSAKCTAGSAVGVCSQGASLESRVEDVNYTPIYNAASAAAACTTLRGIFNANYVP